MWTVVATASLIVGLVVALAFAFASTGASDVPVVSNIQSRVSGEVVTFRWQDPGIESTDSYQITTTDGQSIVQRSPEFTVDADPGERVCITVMVNREGRSGAASGEKCADVPG